MSFEKELRNRRLTRHPGSSWRRTRDDMSNDDNSHRYRVDLTACGSVSWSGVSLRLAFEASPKVVYLLLTLSTVAPLAIRIVP